MSEPTALPNLFGPARQTEIYTAAKTCGLDGRTPTSFAALERAAETAMSAEAWAYIGGSAGAERTARANLDAFDRFRIVPRMWRDVSRRSLATHLFGAELPTPLLLSPIGVQEMAHPKADAATARACAATGVPMIVSNQASVPMETLARLMGGTPWWMQLYWGKSPDLVASLAARAERAGCSAIVITLDTPILGWRPRDLDLGHLPFLKGQGIAQYTSDPVFRAILPRPPEDDMLAAARLFMEIYSNPALTWPDLAFLRAKTRLPIIMKGILHPGDAVLALDHGADGIIVSNHGGRQIDGCVAAIDMLEPVVRSVDGRGPVLFDSGIRGGADIFKALALGATAVCLGRPYAYGLAISGEAGVASVITDILAELDLTLGLSGHSTISEIGQDSIVMQR